MCIHKCFEVVFSQQRGRVEPTTYCDASRNHGCEGCLCRFPLFVSHSVPCNKCGKLNYELLDILWDIRNEMYIFAQKYKCCSFSTMFLENCKMDRVLFELLKDFDWSGKSRAQIIRFHEIYANDVTRLFYLHHHLFYHDIRQCFPSLQELRRFISSLSLGSLVV